MTSKLTTHRDPRTGCVRRAFTIIELLVVISIITLMISLLLPSLSASKERTRAAACSSNLRQLGIGVVNYADNSNSYFPVGVLPGSGDWLWPAIVRGQVNDMDLFYCPSAPAFTRWVRQSSPGTPAHPTGWKQDEYRLGPGRGSFFSYGMNVWGAPCCADAYGTGTYYNHGSLGERKMTTVVSPSRFIVMGDSNWDVSQAGDVNWSAYIGMYAIRQYPLELHQGAANILHGDGHVEPLPRTKTVTATADPDVISRWHRDNKLHWPL